MASVSHLPLAVLLLLASGPAAGSVEADGAALATWRGGALDRARLVELADPDGEALALGGDRLRQAACKATFLEIYSEQARAAGLDEDAEVAAKLAGARRDVLAGAWVRRHRPAAEALVPEAAVRAAHEGDFAGRWGLPEQVELDLLLVRCDPGSPDRSACRARRDELDARRAEGAGLEELAAAEKERTGAANGRFRLAAKALDRDLAAAVARLAPGGTSGWIETLHGFARVRLVSREPSRARPFAEVAGVVHGALLGEAQEAWRQAEAARLRPTLAGLPPSAAPEEVFAAAAAAQGLDREPEVAAALARRRTWVLADAAFFADPELTPSDAEVAAARSRLAERLTRTRLAVATIDAGGDLGAALARAARVRAALDGAADPAATLRALAASDPEIRLDELPPATASELRRRSPHLAEVAAELAAAGTPGGRWRGPDGVGWAAVPPAEGPAAGESDRRGLAFVVLVETLPPGDGEIRLELRRELRGRLSGGAEAFLAVMGPRWGVELSVP